MPVMAAAATSHCFGANSFATVAQGNRRSPAEGADHVGQARQVRPRLQFGGAASDKASNWCSGSGGSRRTGTCRLDPTQCSHRLYQRQEAGIGSGAVLIPPPTCILARPMSASFAVAPACQLA